MHELKNQVPPSTHTGPQPRSDGLVGSWDLVALTDNHRRSDHWPNVVGLLTWSPDGTFTFQMQRPDDNVVSAWGRHHWPSANSVTHIVEWHTNPDKIGTCITLRIMTASRTRLVCTLSESCRFVFER